uniref:DBP10 C-terminal domain-containing protein n=1 Tax=Eptatretus burgeri TaxID=7764 RepID=A0A8C4N3E1_EPTBU
MPSIVILYMSNCFELISTLSSFRDRKRKRFVREGGSEDAKKKMKTESGHYIATSYKSNFYEEWKKKYKIDDRLSEGESGDEGRQRGMKSAMQSTRGRGSRGRRSFGRFASGRPGGSSRVRSELRSNEQILKERRRKARNKELQRPRSERWRGGHRGPPGRGRERSAHGPPRGRAVSYLSIHWDQTLCRALVLLKQSPSLLGTILDGSPL